MIGHVHQDEGRAGDQAMVLQESVNAGLGDKLPLVSVKLTASSPGRQARLLKGQVNDRRRHSYRCPNYDLIPFEVMPRLGFANNQSILALFDHVRSHLFSTHWRCRQPVLFCELTPFANRVSRDN